MVAGRCCHHDHGTGASIQTPALVEYFPHQGPARDLRVIVGGIGDALRKNTWRYREASKAVYFAQLSAWGYGLSEEEHIEVDAATAGITIASDDDQTSAESDDRDGDKLGDDQGDQ